jgi:ParB family transcriptional regulator, chromosome partitioning protein
MAKNSVEVYGAEGKTNILLFKPEDLRLVSKESESLFDPRVTQELTEEFINNVDFHGILQPIIVRKNTETGHVEVVAGRQRVRAAIEVNKRRKKRGDGNRLLRVPATIKRGDDLSMMAAMGSENEARVDNTPMQKAQFAQRMLSRGATEGDIATVMMCSQATVKNLLGLLEAPKAVRSAVETGKISAAVGYKLARMPTEEAKARLEQVTTQAPKEKKKRTGAARRQLEIVTGEKAIKSRLEINTIKDVIEDHIQIPGYPKRLMVAVCDWILGDEDELKSILYPDDDSVEKEIEEAGEA